MVSRKGHDEEKRVGKAYPKNHMRTRTQTLQYATTQNARVFQFTAWAWLSVQPLTAVTDVLDVLLDCSGGEVAQLSFRYYQHPLPTAEFADCFHKC